MTLDPEDLDAIRSSLASDPTLLALVVGRVRNDMMSGIDRSKIEPGVVTGMRSRENGFPVLSVLVDGDSVSNVTPVNPVSFKHPRDLAVGERVLVMFDPPNAPYYVGSITDRNANVAGYGRPYATRVVAAANSIATDAINADYVCDGLGADDVKIQAALDDLDSVGGTVVLLEGSYYCASGPDAFTPSIQIDNNQILRGQGSINTVIYFSDGTKRGLDNGGELRDLTVSTGEPGGGGGE